MSRFYMIILSVFLLFTFSFPIYSQVDYSDEILVYFTTGVTKDKNSLVGNISDVNIKTALDKFGISRNNILSAFPNFNESDTLQYNAKYKPIKIPNMSRIFKIKVPANIVREEVIGELSNLETVLFAEPNGIASPMVIPDDDYFSNQWGLKNGSTGRDIHATQAWDIYKGNSNNIIAIIDGGINKTHPDLQSKVSGGDNGYGWDGHGIHVAGIAAATTNNNTGIAGVDWYAKLHSQRIDNADLSGIYNAIVDAVNYSSNVKVLNNSWGLSPSGTYSSTVRMAFAYAYKMNRVAVVVMGNNHGSQTQYPAGFGQGIIAVGATTSNDEWASDYSNTGNHIDVAAPGSYIYSTYLNNGYDYLNGTSMAAPHVSGIASLLKGYNSNLYNDDIEQIIRLSVDDITTYPATSGWDAYTGTGRVNAKKALDYLRAPYVLHHKSVSGGSTHSSTGTYTAIMYGVPGLADGAYIVKRYEVRKSANFGQTYQNTHVWGRGVGTNGFSAANPNYGMGWCDVVSNNNSSATLKTYVYKVWTISGGYVGWKPTSPSNVSFNYTVLGTIPYLSVYISGPSVIYTDELVDLPAPTASGTYTAHPSGGTDAYSYQWHITKPGWVGWIYQGNSKSVRITQTSDFYIRCILTSGSETASDTMFVEVKSGIDLSKTSLHDDELINIEVPNELILKDNYPNPFNPSTTIKFGLPEDSHVKLTIYSITGQKVITLIDNLFSRGYHEINWNGKNEFGTLVANGIYIYELKAGSKRILNKMIFAK